MNLLDAVVVLAAVLAAVGGYRLGLVTRVASWIGLALGLVVALRLIPPAMEELRDTDQPVPLLAAFGILLGCGLIGQGIGYAIGNRFRPRDERGEVTRTDGALGAFAGVLGTLALVWLLLPLLASSPGFSAEQARGSAVAGVLDEYLPDAPDSMQALRVLVGDENFPTVFDALQPTPDPGPPPADSPVGVETSARVARSVVRVEGVACFRVQDGTGWVVDEELVVTNAHVVAGEPTTTVVRDDGDTLEAAVVAFDPGRDLAVLRVPGLDRQPLALADGDAPEGAVFGHPGGGPLRVAPFRVARTLSAVGRDIYGTDLVTRRVLELSADLAPGDSGSALVDPAGRVVGVAFAIAPDRPGVAYALALEEVRAVLDQPLGSRVATGECAA